jgi:hypothetical protein
MTKRILVVAAMALTLVSPAAAGQQQHADTAQTAQASTERSQAAQQPQQNPVEAVNIRLDLTISVTDARGVTVGPAKSASLHVVNRDNGRIRMGRLANVGEANMVVARMPPVLNVDATPWILSAGRVRVSLSFEYSPGHSEGDKGEPIHINERLSAILDDGKPVVVSQTADPASDRQVKVELKATILK